MWKKITQNHFNFKLLFKHILYSAYFKNGMYVIGIINNMKWRR